MIHVPEDMTVTVAAETTLAELQAALAKSRQWLPLDPPEPQLTLRAILERNESGPRRYGYGTVREYVIGLTVRMADGRIVKSGGQVVKNVAGYDLQKLFIGSGGSLGTIQEITFKLRPLPELEKFVACDCSSLDVAATTIENVFASELVPVVFDLYRRENKTNLVLGFDGAREDVEWQSSLAGQLGFQTPANLDYDQALRAGEGLVQKLSVLPSKLLEAVRRLGEVPFVARAGNGIIFHRNGSATPRQVSPAVTALERRLKKEFDPANRLPALSS